MTERIEKIIQLQNPQLSTLPMKSDDAFQAYGNGHKLLHSKLYGQALRYSKPLLACIALGLGIALLSGFSTFGEAAESGRLNSGSNEVDS